MFDTYNNIIILLTVINV